MAKNSTVGLDIGTTCVRGIEVEDDTRRGSGGPVVRAFGQVPLSPGAVREGEVVEHEIVSQAVKQLWEDARFESRSVVLGVGNRRVFTREMTLPYLPLDQLRKSLAFHAQDALPMAVNEVLMDFVPIEEAETETGRGVLGLFAAAQRDTVNAAVLTAQGAGLTVVGVDLNALAVQRAVIRGDLERRTMAVVDIGAKVTNVVVVHQGRPRLARAIAAGGQDATEAVARAVAVPVPEAESMKRRLGVGFQAPPGMEDAAEAVLGASRTLVDAVQGTVSFFQRSYPQLHLEGVLVTGGGAHLPGLGQYLASALRLPCSLGDPLAGAVGGKGRTLDLKGIEPSTLATVMGLTLGDHS